MMTMDFLRQALLYDIGNYAYIVGHRLEMEQGDTAQAHLLMDICSDGNVDRVSRILWLVFTDIKDRMRQVTVNYPAHHDTDDRLYSPDTYRIRLRQDCHLTSDHVQLLTSVIHELLVYRTIHDWLMITHPEYAPSWADRCTLLDRQLDQYLLQTPHVHIRRCQP